MLDVKLFRETSDVVRSLLGSKRYDAADLDRALELDERRRKLLTVVEAARAEKNAVSKRIGRASPDERGELIAQMQEQGRRMEEAERELAVVADAFEGVVARLPNPPLEGVPAEPASEDVEGRLVKTVGEPPVFGFTVRDHLELGELLGWIDVPRASALSGSRFGFLHDGAVFLQGALVAWVGRTLAERGFVLTIPPVLVRSQGLFATGFFPAEKGEIYKLEEEDLFLVGTAEVPLASLHADETVPGERLPLRYAGYSTCFRREAGSHGKDTRGIFRVHQFDKMEMFSFAHPDRSGEEHEHILATEEAIVSGLGLHYRVVEIAASTLGAPAARKYDIEAWIPSQQRFREVTSCSNCTDFQARRLGARARIEGKTRLMHTLNGTAVAIGRMVIAIMENNQLEDGRIRVPEVLRPYVPGGVEILGPSPLAGVRS